MRKYVKCKSFCIYQESGFCQKKQPNISYSGVCEDKKKNIGAYVQDFYSAMGDSNCLLPQNCTKDVRIGLYYAMNIFGLGALYNRHGDFVWYSLFGLEDANKTSLTVDDIIKRNINEGLLQMFSEKCKEGILPPFENEKDVIDKLEDQEKARQESLKKYETMQPKGLGFLSPGGAWYPCAFGEHEKFALEFMGKMCKNIFIELRNTGYKTATDYMVKKCHYVLINNPTGFGTPVVTKSDEYRLTNAQRNFLYDYFMILKEVILAEYYLTEG